MTRQRARTERKAAKKRSEALAEQQSRTLMAKGRFLVDFAKRGVLTRSAREAGVTRATVYRWLNDDADFKALYTEALEDAIDWLEEEARRRAVDGVLEPMVSAGELVTHVRKYSDGLLTMLLKARRPDVYRERHEVTGKDGGPIRIKEEEAKTLTDDELKARILALAAKL